jgi:hypothetical protein
MSAPLTGDGDLLTLRTVDARARRVQISRPNQPPLNLGPCLVRLYENGMVDFELDQPYMFGGGRSDPQAVQTKHIATDISRCVIAWDDGV